MSQFLELFPVTQMSAQFQDRWPRTHSPQLHRKLIARVIVVPALLPEMCVSSRNLRILLCPICIRQRTILEPIHSFLPAHSGAYVPSAGKSSNSSSSSSCAAGFFSAAGSPFLDLSSVTALVVAAEPCAAPDMVAVGG
ncbi:hypothetical protein PMIN05_009332 [Paraphaeosphaeria minitans]